MVEYGGSTIDVRHLHNRSNSANHVYEYILIYTRTLLNYGHSFSLVTRHSSLSLVGLVRVPTVQQLHNLRRHHVLHGVGGVQAVEPEVLVDRVCAVGVEGVLLGSPVRVCGAVTGRVLVASGGGERGWVGEHGGEDGVGVELEDGGIRVGSGKAVSHRSQAVVEVGDVETLERNRAWAVLGSPGGEVDGRDVEEQEVTGSSGVELGWELS